MSTAIGDDRYKRDRSTRDTHIKYEDVQDQAALGGERKQRRCKPRRTFILLPLAAQPSAAGNIPDVVTLVAMLNFYCCTRTQRSHSTVRLQQQYVLRIVLKIAGKLALKRSYSTACCCKCCADATATKSTLTAACSPFFALPQVGCTMIPPNLFVT